MREQRDKIQQAHKSRARQFHRLVLGLEHDAMLVVILIRRILQEPGFIVQRQWNQAQILPRRMIDAPRVALVFTAQQAFRVRSAFGLPCGNDRFRIFFRLGQIDRDVQLTIGTAMFPAIVFRHTRHANVIARARLLVKIPRRRLRTARVFMRKCGLNHRRWRHKTAHQRGIKQIVLRDTVVGNHPAHKCIGHQHIQHRLNLPQCNQLRLAVIRPRIQLQYRQQSVAHLVFIRRSIQPLLAPVAHQGMQCVIDLHLRHEMIFLYLVFLMQIRAYAHRHQCARRKTSAPCRWLICIAAPHFA